MEEQKRKDNAKRSTTKLIPPKKDKTENLSRDEVRSINKKKNHRKRKMKRMVALCLFALAVICAGIALVLTVFFRVDTIQIKVDGDRLYEDKAIIACCGVENGDNLFLVSEKKIIETLTVSMPYIKSVTIERKMPDTLIIKVVSAKSSAAIPYGDGYVIIDPDGKVLDNNAGKIPEGVPKVNGLKVTEPTEGQTVKINGEGNTEDLLEITKAINTSEFVGLTEINFVKKGSFELKYDDRITVKLGSMLDVADKVDRAKVAIDNQNANKPYFVGVLDLRFEPDYFAPETKPESTTDITDENGNVIAPDPDVTGEYNQNNE